MSDSFLSHDWVTNSAGFAKSRTDPGAVTVGHWLRCRGTLSILKGIGGEHAATQAIEANDREGHTNHFAADA